MDHRIKAVINSHPGTGAGTYNLWRYAGEKFGGETLEASTRQFPYWNNPRMRFFIGRENKLPFDSHFLAALIAPRPSLLGSGARDHVGEVWGDQQCYLAVKEVYKLLGEEQKLGFYVSPGGHTRTPEMMRDYYDWLDMQFGRKPFDFKEELYYTYSFDQWKDIAGEDLDLDDFPEKEVDDILELPDEKQIQNLEGWESKSDDVLNNIQWVIGDLPAYEKIEKIELEDERNFGADLMKAEIPLDDKLVAHITYPAEKPDKIPVVIYLHAYLDANGYNWSRGYGWMTSVGERLAQNGYLAVEFDQFGYGSRNGDCGIEFYAEYPDVSALGVMIQDVSKVIDALSQLDWIDKDQIVVTGYSLGGMVGLYASLFDTRIRAVASTCGFGSMRMDAHGKQTEGIMRYSHLRPTIPRLGLFLGNEKRIPYDFHEVLGLIAPRPVLVLAPKLDQDWFHEDVVVCCDEALKIYDLYGSKENLTLMSPNDFNRYPPKYQEMVIDWLEQQVSSAR
jgi:pimeloyl-ACP methyl ester carboxylesterase